MANSMQAAQIRILMACLVKGGFKRKLFRGDFLSDCDCVTVLSSRGRGYFPHSKFIITIKNPECNDTQQMIPNNQYLYVPVNRKIEITEKNGFCGFII